MVDGLKFLYKNKYCMESDGNHIGRQGVLMKNSSDTYQYKICANIGNRVEIEEILRTNKVINIR